MVFSFVTSQFLELGHPFEFHVLAPYKSYRVKLLDSGPASLLHAVPVVEGDQKLSFRPLAELAS